MGHFLVWLIESSLLIMMIFGIRRLFMGKIPYVAVYALWLVVLVRFLVPVNFISTPVSVADLVSHMILNDEDAGDDRAALNKAENTEEMAGQMPVYPSAGDTEKFAVKEEAIAEKAVTENDLVQGQPGSIYDEETAKEVSERIRTVEKTDEGNRKNAKSTGSVLPVDAGPFLGRIWIIGAVVLFLMIFLSNVRLLYRLKKNRVFYGQRGNIKIYTVYDLKNPCLYGFFRPAIYVPKGLVSSGTADEEDLKQMIVHEFVHYRHGDHIWAMLRMLLVSVYWFHPFLWLAASYSKKDAELFCDEGTIRLLGEEKRFYYGEMLVRLAGDHAWGDFFYSMMPMSRKGKEMEQRIRAISRRGRYPKWLLVPLAVILFVTVSMTCSTGIGTMAGEREQISKEEKEPSIQVTDPKDGSGLVSGMVFNDAPYGAVMFFPMADKKVSPLFQNHIIYDDGETVYADTPKEAFTNYLYIFTNSVNTGDTSELEKILAAGSNACRQQCALVDNYHRRGIKEEIRSFSVSSVKRLDRSRAEVNSREKIKVFYADGTSKIIKQRYRYICEIFTVRSLYTERQVWAITNMEAIG